MKTMPEESNKKTAALQPSESDGFRIFTAHKKTRVKKETVPRIAAVSGANPYGSSRFPDLQIHAVFRLLTSFDAMTFLENAPCLQ